MNTKERKYTEEFKKQIVELYENGKTVIYQDLRIWVGRTDNLQMDSPLWTICKKWTGGNCNSGRRKSHAAEDSWTWDGIKNGVRTSLTFILKKKYGLILFRLRTIDAEFAVRALKNAALNVKCTEGIIIQSDLGCHYISNLFESALAELKIRHSYSKKGYPYDNSCIESWYNRKRIHLSLNYRTPEAVYSECENLAA